jgi:hypothetical protein
MKLATGGRAKVFAVGLKDRAALLTAGHMADGAFWFDVLSGAFVTSSAYKDRLPPYIRVINESQSLRQYAGKSWKLLDDRGTYTFHRPDDSPLELPGYNLSKAFPHTLTTEFPSEEFNRQFSATYFANEFTLKLASAIIDTEQLGRDDTADLLFVNFSANDYVGHHFGPYSVEVEDMFRRTDQMLGDFTRLLDSVVGPGKWTLAVSSDHGVAPIPEFAAEIGLKGIRDPLGDLEKFTAHLESLLQARFPSKDEAKIVQFVEKSQVFLNYAHPLLKGPKRSRVIQTTRDLLLAHPSVAVAVSRDDLLKGGGGGGPLRRRFFRAFHAGRSGDVLFAHHPYQFAPGDYTTSHGSPWDYDSHVAMMLLGDGVKQLRSDHPCDPSQLAVTLANLLGIGPPAAANPAPLP